MKRFLIFSTSVTFLAAGALLAQNPNDQPPEADGQPDGQYEQGRAVARISVINGDVSVRRGDSNEVVAAAMNAPLLANDTLLTSSSSRAEIQLDYGKILRVGPNSEVRFVGMDIKSFQIQVAAGTVTFRVLRPSESQAEVDTPSIAVRPMREGVYRISVREDGTSEITVRSGEAEIGSPRGTERLEAGRTMYARGSADDPEFQVAAAIGLDSWDRWNEDRDRYLERSRSYEHVSRDIYGAEDLDQYGQWVDDPSYGQVWAPAVAPGWAPYRDGRWVWEDWYGWTWVSYDPWGWAPYHYGRWFYGGRGWCWYPGPIYGRHFWAPAYVGFFGFGGGHFGVGFGFGGLGWVPLAPFERFHPWWGRGFYGGFRNGGNRFNIVNNINITNTFRNARVNGGVTGVNTAEFGRNNGRFQTLNHAQIQQAGLVRGAVPVAPDRSSLRLSDRNAQGNFPRTNVQNFASRSQAPRVDRVPFDQQQRGMQQFTRGNVNAGAGNSGVGANGGANGGWQRSGGSQVDTNRGNFTPNNNGRGVNPAVQQPGGGQGNHDWGRFGQPIHGTGGATPQSQAPANRYGNQGWQRFENTRPNNGGSNGNPAPRNFTEGRGYQGGGGSQPVRISPPIVQQRNYNPSPSYQAPRNYNPPPSYQAPRNYSPSPSYQAPRNNPSPSYQAPRNYGGGGGGRSAPSGGGGGGSRGGGGGGGRPSGGGGGSRGGGHR
ncbi:MAG TPA: FecR family protein [Bryobacteraceae bacterium]|nr:FecR family protein [Bryobacteraceae bacterium]